MTDKILPMPGAWHSATFIIRISTCTNHRRISHTAPLLLEHTTGTCSRCQVTLLVQYHTAHSSILLALLLQILYPLQRLRSSKIHIIHNFQSLWLCKPVGPLTCQHHMRCFIFYRIGCINRILHRFQPGDSSCCQILTFHNRSIQFKSTGTGTSSPFTSIKQGVILKIVNNCHYRFRSFTTSIQYSISDTQSWI